MKPLLFLLIAGLLLSAHAAKAQVMINQAALDQLAGISPQAGAPPVITAPPAIRRPAHKIAYRRPLPKHLAHPVQLAAKPSPPSVPPPPKPEIQPVVARPAPLPPAPPKPPLPRTATIAFAAGGSSLPSNAAAALKPFCAHPAGMITIDAYADANPGDPSQAARLSLSRAFAIRDALTACGVNSSNIIPRANGANAKNPDAAEVSAAP